MTLIACTINKKQPVLIGDILITSDEANASIQLPTNSFDITQHLTPSNSYPVCLMQKIYIIKKNLCIALAGRVYEMRDFLREFTMQCSYYDNITEEDIKSAMSNYNCDVYFAKSACFITLICNGENGSVNVTHFSYPTKDWDSIESEPFKKTYASGSGAEAFLSQVAAEANFKGDSNRGILSAITNNVCFLARLLAAEKVSLYTVNGKWGAGFETIYFDGDSFVKFESMAYVIMQGSFNESGDIGIPVPRQVMYYKYHNDILFISSIEILKGEVNSSDNEIIFTSTQYKADCYIVPRIDTDFRSPLNLPTDYSFETNRIALGYALVEKDNGFFAPSFFSTSKNDINVIFKDKESIEIKINYQVTEMIKSGAREYFLR